MNLRGAVVAAVMRVLCAPSFVAAATDADSRGKGHADFVPVKTLAGSTGGELVGQWWAQLLAIPAAENPLFPPSPARCLRLGRHGKVAARAGTARSAPLTCTIKAGTPLFLAAGLSECSSGEPEPYRAFTEEEQRECAIELFSLTSPIVATLMSLDGRPAVEIHTERFQLVSPQTPVVSPKARSTTPKPVRRRSSEPHTRQLRASGCVPGGTHSQSSSSALTGRRA